jgi:phthalate 4,5-dioxygenase
MLSQAENELLTRTGPDTPMGQYFRRFWIPVLLSRELSEPDCAPLRIKVVGEPLLAFRDTKGKVGIIEARCPHRGADLFYGRNEECGIRCSYHGWKFNTDGECTDAPTLTVDNRYDMIRSRIRVKSYPVREWGDLIWAYMGPPDQPAPELPMMEFALVPPTHRHVSKKFQQCNWAQAVEGGLDTAHFSFLHMPIATEDDTFKAQAAQTTKGFSTKTMSADHIRWMRNDSRPKFTIAKHDAGLVLGASRHADDGELYWRVAQFLLPSHCYTPSAAEGEVYHGQTMVPVDDHSCWIYVYSWNPDRPLTDAEVEGYKKGGAVYSEVDDRYMPVRNRANDYEIDRGMQKTENYTGIKGLSEQDAAIQDSQGLIVDRTCEILGPTDAGVVQFRLSMLDGAKSLQKGIAPAAAHNPGAYRVRGGATIAPGSQAFRDVMMARFGDPYGRFNVELSEGEMNALVTPR